MDYETTTYIANGIFDPAKDQSADNPAVKAKLERAVRSLREISARITSLEMRVNGPQPVSPPENGAIQTIPASYQHLSAELSEGAEIILKRLDNLATEM